MGDTAISWTHRPATRGRTWNPTNGCKVVSPGCANCYAMRFAGRFSAPGQRYHGLVTIAKNKRAVWTGESRLEQHMLDLPLRWRAPSTVFVNSMSDLFYEGFSNEQIAAVFGVMAACPQHTFQILTKRARRMREWFEWLDESIETEAAEWSGRDCAVSIHDARAQERQLQLADCAATQLSDGSEDAHGAWLMRLNDAHADCWARAGSDGGTEWLLPWPLPNVWLGVSTEHQDAADERIPELLATPAAVRFLSCEPLIGPVDLQRVRHDLGGESYEIGSCLEGDDGFGLNAPRERIDWVITGCESGPGARQCDFTWLRALRDQCATAGVPFFLKQAAPDLEQCDDCGERIRYELQSRDEGLAWCGCTIEGPESCNTPGVWFGPGSKRKAGGVIELPYLDGVQHAAFPEVP